MTTPLMVVRPNTTWPPQKEWLTEFASRSPYNEEVIVRLITDWYKLLVRFSYVDPANIEWAPPEGRTIDEGLCNELGLAPAVIRLMTLLPQHRMTEEVKEFNLFSGSRTFVWSDSGDIRASRDLGNGQTPYPVLPKDLALTHAMDLGTSIMIDTEENTVYLTHCEHGVESKEPLEVPDDEGHYRNCLPRHAPSFFKRQIELVQSLSLIPSNCPGAPREMLDFCGGQVHPNMYPRIKKILVDDYGWPDSFREDDWRRNCAGLWDSTLEDLDEAGLYL